MLFYYTQIHPESAVTVNPVRTALALLFIAVAFNVGAASHPPRVVASIAPLHSLVAAVMSGRGEPLLLLSGSESPHTFSLRPSDARAINNADLVIWIGPELEQPLERILPTLSAKRSISMLSLPGLELLAQKGVHDHAEHVQADKTHKSSLSSIDPHIWLSPGNAQRMVDAIADALITADPDGTDLYRRNADALNQRLADLDDELRAQLHGLEARYTVFHNAYQYFERRYGLHPVSGITTHPERRPGAGHLRWLRKALRDEQVRCLFSEPQFDDRLVDMLSEGLPIRHAVLDPLGASIEPGPEAYFETLRQMGRTMHECLTEADR